MDAMQDKQKPIGDEWAFIGIAGAAIGRCDGGMAVVQNLPQISAKHTLSPTKSHHENHLEHAIMFAWMLCKTNKSPLGMNGLLLELLEQIGR